MEAQSPSQILTTGSRRPEQTEAVEATGRPGDDNCNFITNDDSSPSPSSLAENDVSDGKDFSSGKDASDEEIDDTSSNVPLSSAPSATVAASRKARRSVLDFSPITGISPTEGLRLEAKITGTETRCPSNKNSSKKNMYTVRRSS